MKQPKMDWNTM